MATQLTPHFSLEELTTSGHHPDIENVPRTDAVVANLTRQLAPKLEYLRAILDRPIVVAYGFRCPALNNAVGGSPTSAHAYGLAADTVCAGLSIEDMFKAATDDDEFMLDVDQLILERGCLHVGLLVPGTHPAPRRELRGDSFNPETGKREYPLLGIWSPKGGSNG